MPAAGKLDITKPKGSRQWILNVSAKTSPTGKRQRLKFDTKAAAEDHRTKLAATIASPRLKRFDDKLLETANYYNETFQIYGFSGLAEACAAFVSQLDKTTVSMSLTELIESYREARGADWSKGYINTFDWAKKQLEDFHAEQLSTLDADHWQQWLPKWRKSGDYSARSFNHLRTFLVSLYSLPSAVKVYPQNPVKLIPPAKQKKKEVIIAGNQQTRDILHRTYDEDPELTPWFAIAFFAGLRPDSELAKLDWKDINFDEKWIRIGFGNKTDTKRFVDLSDTLTAWLTPFKKVSGQILPKNIRKRKNTLIDGILTWERDITRHTYGSNLEAQARAEGKDAKATVLTNMGHNVAQTFEQHYRNARTAKQAAEFWAIAPPKRKSGTKKK